MARQKYDYYIHPPWKFEVGQVVRVRRYRTLKSHHVGGQSKYYSKIGKIAHRNYANTHRGSWNSSKHKHNYYFITGFKVPIYHDHYTWHEKDLLPIKHTELLKLTVVDSSLLIPKDLELSKKYLGIFHHTEKATKSDFDTMLIHTSIP